MDTQQLVKLIKDSILIADAKGGGPNDSYHHYRRYADDKVIIDWSRWYGRGLTIFLRTDPDVIVLRYVHRRGRMDKDIEGFRPGCWMDYITKLAVQVRGEKVQAAKMLAVSEKKAVEIAFSPIDDRAIFEAAA